MFDAANFGGSTVHALSLFFGFWIGLLARGSVPALADEPMAARWDREATRRFHCPFDAAETCQATGKSRQRGSRFAGAEQFVDPEDLGAIGDGVVDDTKAILAAASRAVAIGMPMRLNKNYRVSSSQNLACDVIFHDGKIIVDEGAALTITGNISAPKIAHLFVGSVATPKAPVVSVAWWGALVNADAAPAFRAAVGSNRTYFVPPGTYTLSTYVDDCLPGATFGPQVIINFCNISNFHIEAYGAVIKTVPDPVHHTTEIMVMQGDSNFSVAGGTWQGSLSSGNLLGLGTCVAVIFNSTDFTFKDMHLTKRYTQGFAGDFDKNGIFTNIQLDASSMGFDLAYQQNISFDHITATGLSFDGTASPGQALISLISDTVNLPYRTVSFGAFTKNISVSNSSASHFAFTYHITDGSKYNFRNNTSNGTNTSFDYYIVTTSGRSVGNINITGAISTGFKSSVYFVPGPLGKDQSFHDIIISSSTFSNDAIAIDVEGDPRKVTNLKLDPNLLFRRNGADIGGQLKALNRTPF
jgi:hypothetical protein